MEGAPCYGTSYIAQYAVSCALPLDVTSGLASSGAQYLCLQAAADSTSAMIDAAKVHLMVHLMGEGWMGGYVRGKRCAVSGTNDTAQLTSRATQGWFATNLSRMHVCVECMGVL